MFIAGQERVAEKYVEQDAAPDRAENDGDQENQRCPPAQGFPQNGETGGIGGGLCDRSVPRTGVSAGIPGKVDG